MADSFRSVPAWKFCRACKPLVQDMGTNVAGIALCAGCQAMTEAAMTEAAKKFIVDARAHTHEKDRDAPEVDWTIDQECWKLESIVDGGYRLTKKSIADISETTGSILVTDDDLGDLMKVLAARGALEG